MSVDVTLYQRLDEQICALTDNFCNMVRSSLIPEEDDDVVKSQATQVPGELAEVFAAKLLNNAHTALNLVSELKKSAMQSDVTALTQNSRYVKQILEDEAMIGERDTTNMRRDAEELLRQLEEHYYSSKFKVDVAEEEGEGVWEDLFVRGLDNPIQGTSSWAARGAQGPKPESSSRGK